MTEYTFEDLSKQTVAQLRKIAVGVEHEALQDPAKMPSWTCKKRLQVQEGKSSAAQPSRLVSSKTSS